MNYRQSILLWVISAVIFAALSTPAPAHACSCKPMAPPAEAAEHAEVIFVATPQPGLSTSSPGTPLKVTRVYKGSVAVDENLERTDCWSPVDVVSRDAPSPGEVLIYGYRMVHGPVAPGMCSRSKLLKDAGEDIAFLEKTFRATEPTPSPGSAATTPPAPTTTVPSSPASPSGSGDAADPSTPATAEPPSIPPGPRSGCACALAESEASSPRFAAPIALAALALIARRRFGRLPASLLRHGRHRG